MGVACVEYSAEPVCIRNPPRAVSSWMGMCWRAGQRHVHSRAAYMVAQPQNDWRVVCPELRRRLVSLRIGWPSAIHTNALHVARELEARGLTACYTCHTDRTCFVLSRRPWNGGSSPCLVCFPNVPCALSWVWGRDAMRCDGCDVFGGGETRVFPATCWSTI